MSEYKSPSRAASWLIVRATDEVAGGEEIVAGPLSDKAAAERLAESFGPNHIVRRGAMLDAEEMGPTDPVGPG